MTSNENIVKLRGSFDTKKDTRGGASTIPSAVIGIVKNNIDVTRSGKIDVFLLRGNSANQDNPASWVPVNYMSPFFGYTQNTASKDDTGSYVGNPSSYGMWMTTPDIGTEVLCVFLNGDINFGYYIGALPKPGMTHMVPAVGSSDYVVPNSGEAESYGGAKRLPVTEFNNANDKLKDSPTLAYNPRPVHSYQAAILFNQGLLKDEDRGSISSSSMRESPSHVFGISTPGRPIYQGGYDDTTIGDAIKSDAKNENFKIVGRRGGHSLVMDDGDLYGKDQLIRLRTASGHTILMNDYAQTLMIMHANGQSYIEFGREGTIDMYSTNSVNIRTEGDLNLHADRNININAAGDLNISGKNTKIESLQSMTQYAGNTFEGYAKGDYTVKGESNYAVETAGDIGHKAKGTVFINGGKKKPNVKINSGNISTTPKAVTQIGINVLTDTLRDDTKGYNPAPAKLSSIVNRAPAHMPWADAGKGVDKKTDKSASSAFPSNPSAGLSAVNASVPDVPSNPTNVGLASTVPNLADASNATQGQQSSLTTPAMTGIVSQMAVNAATGSSASIVNSTGVGTITNSNGIKTASIGNFAFNATQMCSAGTLKPGSDVAINAALNNGKSVQEAFHSSMFTGQNGVTNLSQFVNDTNAQTRTAGSLLVSSETSLKTAGIITGNEHSTQTGGLILSTATIGLKATSNFLSSSSNLGSAGSAATGLTASTAGSAKDLISSGNFSANLADKSLVALSGIKLGAINVVNSIKGFASSLYSSVVNAFKPLKPNVPQNLAADSSPPAGAASSGQGLSTTSLANSPLGTSVPGINSASLGGLPGGSSAVTNNTSAPVTSTGLTSINTQVTGLASSVNSGGFGSAVSSAKSLLGGGASLSSIAAGGIDPSKLSSLNSLLSSLGRGVMSISLPKVATDTFNVSKVKEQNKSLLGDSKVPSPVYGTSKAPEPNVAGKATLTDLTEQVNAELENFDKLTESYNSAEAKYGENAAQTKTALIKLSASAQKLEKLQEQLEKTVII